MTPDTLQETFQCSTHHEQHSSQQSKFGLYVAEQVRCQMLRTPRLLREALRCGCRHEAADTRSPGLQGGRVSWSTLDGSRESSRLARQHQPKHTPAAWISMACIALSVTLSMSYGTCATKSLSKHSVTLCSWSATVSKKRPLIRTLLCEKLSRDTQRLGALPSRKWRVGSASLLLVPPSWHRHFEHRIRDFSLQIRT